MLEAREKLLIKLGIHASSFHRAITIFCVLQKVFGTIYESWSPQSGKLLKSSTRRELKQRHILMYSKSPLQGKVS